LAEGEIPSSRTLLGLQTREGGDAENEVAEDTLYYNGVLFSNLTIPGMSFAAALRDQTEE
jgi:hypothetical protein